jgi:hypothetical protein
MKMPKERQPWFAARESGASFYPVTWQGYAVTIGYVVLLSLSSIAIARSWALFIGLAVGLTIFLFIIVSATSSQF